MAWHVAQTERLVPTQSSGGMVLVLGSAAWPRFHTVRMSEIGGRPRFPTLSLARYGTGHPSTRRVGLTTSSQAQSQKRWSDVCGLIYGVPVSPSWQGDRSLLNGPGASRARCLNAIVVAGRPFVQHSALGNLLAPYDLNPSRQSQRGQIEGSAHYLCGGGHDWE